MTILSKVIYRFNAIPIKLLRAFFTDLEGKIFFVRKYKKASNNHSNLKENRAGGIRLHNF